MNVFSFNQASGNHVRDVEDQNSHCGTDVWVDNAFGNRQPKLRSLSGPPICVHTSRMLRVSPVVVLLFSVAVLNAQHGMVAAAGGGASTIGVVNTARTRPRHRSPSQGNLRHSPSRLVAHRPFYQELPVRGGPHRPRNGRH